MGCLCSLYSSFDVVVETDMVLLVHHDVDRAVLFGWTFVIVGRFIECYFGFRIRSVCYGPMLLDIPNSAILFSLMKFIHPISLVLPEGWLIILNNQIDDRLAFSTSRLSSSFPLITVNHIFIVQHDPASRVVLFVLERMATELWNMHLLNSINILPSNV